MNPHPLYDGLRDHFGITTTPNKYLCKAALLIDEVKLDVLALDDYLHKVHGDYEEDNLSMSMLIEREYSPQAHSFVARFL